MAERYNKLYTLPGNLYAAASPVLISAGALLKDNQTGKVLAQLKFKNISERAISALKVLVIGYDMSNEEVCRAEHQYLDLKDEPTDSFGAKEAIPLPDSSVRSYTARVLSVHFADGGRYASNDQPWEALPEAEHLRNRLFDRELIRQYRMETSSKSEYVPLEHKDIWRCSCGEINQLGESCFACKQELDTLKDLLNVDLLLEKKNDRLLEESKQAAARETSRAHSAKIVKIILAVLIPLLLASAACFYFYNRSIQRQADYEMAGVLLAAGNYTEAAVAYDALGDYLDSPSKAAEIRSILSEMNNYDKAQKFLENGRYDDAYEAFSAMGNYEQAPQLAKEAHYQKALKLAAEGECEQAEALFISLGDYEDSAARAKCFIDVLSQTEASYNAECEGPLTTSYTYDDMGRIAVKTEHFSAYPELKDRVFEYSWGGDGSHTESVGKSLRSYDTWGILLSENGESQYSYDYGYYDDGSLKYYGAYSVSDEGFVFEVVYDEHGNQTRYTSADGSSSTTVNEYDEAGKLVKQENFDPSGAFVDRTAYEYDDEGRLKRSTYMDLNNTTIVTSYSYTRIYAPGLAA